MSRFAQAVQRFGGRREVARMLGCSVEMVRLMSVGKSKPGLALALKIEEQLRVPVTYWKGRSAASEPTP